MRVTFRARAICLAVSTAALASGCADDTVDSTAALLSAVNEAQAGDRIVIEAGTYDLREPLVARVPLTLEGNGTVRIVGPSDLGAPMLDIQAASTPTRIVNISFVASDSFAIRAVGAGGAVEMEDVNITAAMGADVGFAADGLASLHMTRVNVDGPITVADRNDPRRVEGKATHGIILLRVDDAQLDHVSSSGFALFGALLVDSDTKWTEGVISRNIPTGFMAYGGNAELTNVEISDVWQGGGLMPAYGAVFAGDATGMTNGLVVRTSASYGILHDHSNVTHMGIDASDNASAALWAQDAALSVLGNSRLQNNALAGVVGYHAELTVEDSEILDTRNMRRVMNAMPIDFGDGVQIFESTQAVRLAGLNLVRNERVGLLLDLAGADSGLISVEAIRVEVAEPNPDDVRAAYGAVAINGDLPMNWDNEIERVGIEAAIDMGVDDLAIVGPSDSPAPLQDSVSLDNLLGYVTIVGPSD